MVRHLASTAERIASEPADDRCQSTSGVGMGASVMGSGQPEPAARWRRRLATPSAASACALSSGDIGPSASPMAWASMRL